MPVRVGAQIQALPRTVGVARSARTGGPLLAVWAAASFLVAASRVASADPPTLLVLPLEMIDTSGEAHPQSDTHADRLAALTRYLSRQLDEDRLYTVVDPAPIAADIGRAQATQPIDRCNGCERDLARLVHADRVLVGEIDKVSTLIGSLRLDIVDVATGRSVFSRDLGFRGDTDDAWQHAARFFVRDLGETPAQQR
jgi:hypothetical protein